MRRRLARGGVLPALAAVAVVGALATAAWAVCGDANGDGEVSVSDGVQALRAAAGLSSACDDDCDVDGNGAFTVTDGVNILRDAGGLASIRMCPQQGDRVGSLIGHTIGLFGPLTKVGAIGPTPAGSVSPCDNAEGSFQQTSSGFVFGNCVFGSVSFTGFLGAPGDGSLDFSNLQITRSGDVQTLQGTLNVDASGENPELNGQLDASTPILGSYRITFGQVATDGVGNTVGGSLVFDVSDANIENIVEVRVTLTGGDHLPVIVRFADQTTGNFSYDTQTDELTPTQGTPTPTPIATATPPAARVRLSNIDDRITAFLNGKQVLQATSGPGGTPDTGFQSVTGLVCGDNLFEFRVENTVTSSGYTFRVQLEVDGDVVVDRACGQVGVQGCRSNDLTQGEVVRDVTFVCVPCGPCTAGAGTCANPLTIPASGRITVHGRTAGSSKIANACSAPGGGAESVFVFAPATTGCFEFSTCDSSFDTQLALGDGLCAGSSAGFPQNCVDDNITCPGSGAPGDGTFGFFSGGQAFPIIVDGASNSESGDYTLDVRPSGQCIL